MRSTFSWNLKKKFVNISQFKMSSQVASAIEELSMNPILINCFQVSAGSGSLHCYWRYFESCMILEKQLGKKKLA